MLLAPHRLQRPNETQLNQHQTRRWRSNRPVITKDTPDSSRALGKGIRLPVGDILQGLPVPAQPRDQQLLLEGRAVLRKVWLAGWPPSRPMQPQPAAVRQPTPRPGCVQDLALKWIQSGMKDVDLWSGCRSSSSLIEPGRNRSTCSGGVRPLLRGGTGLLSRGLGRLCWTLPSNSEPCGNTMSAVWMLATSLGCLREQGREGMHIDLPGLSGYLPSNP